MKKTQCLVILDGWGLGEPGPHNAITTAGTPKLDKWRARYPHAELRTDGLAVGLPSGQMGNSEVGHMNIGAGRVLYQDLVKITKALESNAMDTNPVWQAALEAAKAPGASLHLMGLMSPGGVHAMDSHMFDLIARARRAGVSRVVVHAFMDGRDTDPKSGAAVIRTLQSVCEKEGALLASLVGRYYAMDRDNRWERIRVAHSLLTEGTGEAFVDAAQAVENFYALGVTDEFMPAMVNAVDPGLIEDGDVVLFTNFRNDRAKELTRAIALEPIEDMMPKQVMMVSMTPYDATFESVHVLFPKELVTDTLGEVIAGRGMTQLRCAETEKYAHVTFFFNGGREAPFENESRVLIPSPQVATYDTAPAMSAYAVRDAVIDAIKSHQYDFICVNFANGDMVGHTGVFDAIQEAVRVIDDCVDAIFTVAQAEGASVMQIADHGNADHAKNPDGSPNTAHSLNPVPCLVVDDRVAHVDNGVLADVAPTLLTLMGVPIPDAMTGRVLVTMKSAS